MNVLDLHQRDKGVAKYTSTKELLKHHLQTDINAKYRKNSAAMYFWLLWLVVAFKIKRVYPEDLGLANTGVDIFSVV